MKKLKSLMILCLTAALVLPSISEPKNVSALTEGDLLNMADPQASKHTKALFKYLKDVSGHQILFGHQHATDEGLTLTNEAPRTASEQSEVLNAVGDYPAVFGWDTGSLDGNEKPGVSADTIDQNIENTIASMKKTHELGGIIALSMHPKNFVTDGPYNDTTGSVVEKILPGGSNHADFNEWLDRLASLAQGLKDENGEAIPIIFRPFHEQTGNWFWWGAHETSPEQYKAIYRYTVDYLRDEKEVHNILYGFSPGAGPGGALDRYMETYPGDQYVDIFGIDKYDDKNNAGSPGFLEDMVKDLAMIAKLAEERGKVSAFTEYGYSASGMNKTGNNLEWYTDVLEAIKANPDASKISYMQTWANFGWPNNMYVPYRDVNGDLGGDHELLPNFIDFYQDDLTAFRNEVQGFYDKKEYEDLKTVEHEPFMHLLSPVSGSVVTEESTKIRVKILNDNPQKVVYSEEGSEKEYEMTLDEDGFYSALWSPSAAVNGSSTTLIIKAVKEDGTYFETISSKIFVKVPEISLADFTFDEDIAGVQNNGTYPESDNVEFSHAKVNEDGKLRFAADIDQQETWQELKLQVRNLSADHLALLNRVKLDVLIPEEAGAKDSSVRSIAMLPPNWDVKFGKASTVKSFEDLEKIIIDGVSYRQYQASIDLTDKELLSSAEGLAISFIGSRLDLSKGVYIDNIELINSYTEAPQDPLLVDNFEGYLGDDSLLNQEYSSNGDPIILSLNEENKNSGNYGLAYHFTIGSSGYAGRQTSLGPVDWTGTNAFEFWLKHESYPQNLTIQIQMGGVSFESNLALDEEFEGKVRIPFADFVPAAWENKPGVVVDQTKLKSVSQFALYTGGPSGSGVVYVDDLKAVSDEGLPGVPPGDSTPPPIEEVEPIIFTFNDTLEGWEGAQASTEDGSLKALVELGSGKKSTVQKTAAYNLANYNYIIAYVKHDENGEFGSEPLKAKLFTKAGSWTWSDSGEIAINKQEYTKMVFDITNLPDKQAVQEMGIEFLAPAQSVGTTYASIDSVQVVQSLDEAIDPEHPEETIMFLDVPKKHWAYPYISYGAQEGFLSGDNDGRFKPNGLLSRGEAVAIVAKQLQWDIEGSLGEKEFERNSMNYAERAGLFKGFKTRKLRPQSRMTRGEMALFISNAYDLGQNTAFPYKDVSRNTMGYREISQMKNLGIVSGRNTGKTFRPNAPLTRADFSAVLASVLEEKWRVN
ncbi:CIA30 family protein [Jeotgalibacillus sp. ET6]|uniref:glycosyl hydrolase n=1 Tax=Jeotgalibacillus sp. ET6 TaxID=3037260 RepID=UPI0024184505|nr:glycosyl hydrolase [Jeotgalibacillus sp. ET6]MDG5471526.1 CIA30 family protein [Jeotgalibacillus sp. ET6]